MHFPRFLQEAPVGRICRYYVAHTYLDMDQKIRCQGPTRAQLQVNFGSDKFNDGLVKSKNLNLYEA